MFTFTLDTPLFLCLRNTKTLRHKMGIAHNWLHLHIYYFKYQQMCACTTYCNRDKSNTCAAWKDNLCNLMFCCDRLLPDSQSGCLDLFHHDLLTPTVLLHPPFVQFPGDTLMMCTFFYSLTRPKVSGVRASHYFPLSSPLISCLFIQISLLRVLSFDGLF